jgi:hypothetical protein
MHLTPLLPVFLLYLFWFNPSSQQSERWRRYTPSDSSFSVDFPKKPDIETEKQDKTERCSAVEFNVSTLEFIDSFKVTIYDSALLPEKSEKAIDQYTNLFIGRSEKPVVLDKISTSGIQAREFQFTDGEIFVKGRSILAGSRFYIVHYDSLNHEESAEQAIARANRFLNSFKIEKISASVPHQMPECSGHLPFAERGQIALVRFPDPWLENDQKILPDVFWYEIRQMPDSGKFLFAAMSGTGYWGEIYRKEQKDDWYSANIYEVAPLDSSVIREATLREWNLAKKVSRRPEKLFPRLQEDMKQKDYTYKGRKYPKRGQYWGTVILSHRSKFIAIYSYSGEKTPVILFSGGEPRTGDIFWDVYNTATGEKVLAWKASSVRNPSMLSEGSVWIEEDFLVMPYNFGLQECVVGRLQ